MYKLDCTITTYKNINISVKQYYILYKTDFEVKYKSLLNFNQQASKGSKIIFCISTTTCNENILFPWDFRPEFMMWNVCAKWHLPLMNTHPSTNEYLFHLSLFQNNNISPIYLFSYILSLPNLIQHWMLTKSRLSFWYSI